MPSLTRDEARLRSALLEVWDVAIDLDLAQGPHTFGSRTRITFSCREPGASTFVDFRPKSFHSATLNGRPLAPEHLRDGRLILTDLAADNLLEVAGSMSYSRDGQGLHRSVDPVDGEAYIFGHLFLDAAPRVFACFDQPDLKATYAVTVTTPEHWSVIGNGATSPDPQVAREGSRRWRLEPTHVLATYFVTVCAGPWVSVTDAHDGIPLGVHARRSLEVPLREQAADILETTRSGFDHYHGLFGIRYPFGKYDQVFVPEFNSGAMENPGCVTLRDSLLFRGRVSQVELLHRASTIVHEQAHMWFGNLVTLRWWDDLWLNESFAEYMAYRALAAGPDHPSAWVDFGMSRKMWGYAADRAPSTHPVAGSSAPDAMTALGNFDGISYAKGAAVLRQLVALLGDEVFIAGVGAYLTERAFGNGGLGEFLEVMGRVAGTDLTAWSRAWLETAGADTFTIDAEVGDLVRTTRPERPADREHFLDVVRYREGRAILRDDVRVRAGRTELPGLRHLAPGLTIVNASDLTWAEVDFDETSLAFLAEELPLMPDPVARMVTWVQLLGGVYRGRVDPRWAVEVFETAWPLEREQPVLARVAQNFTERLLPCFISPAERADTLDRVASAASRTLAEAAPHSGRSLIAARLVARTTPKDSILHRWLVGDGLPAGLDGDLDFAWVVARSLASRSRLEDTDLERLLGRDPSLTGSLAGLAVRAVQPTEEAKAWAWAELTTNSSLSNHAAHAIAGAFWSCYDPSITRDYLGLYGDAIAGMQRWMGEDALARVASAVYPTCLVDADTLAMSTTVLARTDIGPTVRRAIIDADHELREALASQARFGKPH